MIGLWHEMVLSGIEGEPGVMEGIEDISARNLQRRNGKPRQLNPAAPGQL